VSPEKEILRRVRGSILMNKKGFTLIEVIVIVMIIAVLATFAIPYVEKLQENSRADNALGVLHAIADGQRNAMIDSPNYISHGLFQNAHNDFTTCDINNIWPQKLLACGYVQKREWDSTYYAYRVCDNGIPASTCCSLNNDYVACASRRNASAPYSSWIYAFTKDGECVAQGTDVRPCPQL
jgi:prepilin-type N-terminal cleavage/methylation domain-containing protein